MRSGGCSAAATVSPCWRANFRHGLADYIGDIEKMKRQEYFSGVTEGMFEQIGFAGMSIEESTEAFASGHEKGKQDGLERGKAEAYQEFLGDVS